MAFSKKTPKKEKRHRRHKSDNGTKRKSKKRHGRKHSSSSGSSSSSPLSSSSLRSLSPPQSEVRKDCSSREEWLSTSSSVSHADRRRPDVCSTGDSVIRCEKPQFSSLSGAPPDRKQGSVVAVSGKHTHSRRRASHGKRSRSPLSSRCPYTAHRHSSPRNGSCTRSRPRRHPSSSPERDSLAGSDGFSKVESSPGRHEEGKNRFRNPFERPRSNFHDAPRDSSPSDNASSALNCKKTHKSRFARRRNSSFSETPSTDLLHTEKEGSTTKDRFKEHEKGDGDDTLGATTAPSEYEVKAYRQAFGLNVGSYTFVEDEMPLPPSSSCESSKKDVDQRERNRGGEDPITRLPRPPPLLTSRLLKLGTDHPIGGSHKEGVSHERISRKTHPHLYLQCWGCEAFNRKTCHQCWKCKRLFSL